MFSPQIPANMHAAQALCRGPNTISQNGAALSLYHPSGMLRIKTVPAKGVNKKHGSSGFMNKLFHKKESREVGDVGIYNSANSVKSVDDDTTRESELNKTNEEKIKEFVQPCPYIRPLTVKPEARIEEKPFGPRGVRGKLLAVQPPSADGSQHSDSIYASDTQGTTSKYATDSEYESTLEDGSTADVSVVHDEKYQDYDYDHYEQEKCTQAPSAGSFCFMTSQIEYILSFTAREMDPKEPWIQWLKDYANGTFNHSHLPDPPPLSTKFEFLPAMLPPHEATRLQVSARYEPTWQHWGPEKAKLCTEFAIQSFGTECAVMTAFTQECELIKVGFGYALGQNHSIQRRFSIGAHALLSSDLLVVLDTHLDWRFKGNPLVNGQIDHIRFFAATPLLSQDGVATGVLAIFDYRPRISFPADQRQQLLSLGKEIMADLDCLEISLNATQLRTAPATELESRTDDERKSILNYNLLPHALRLQKTKTPPSAPTKSLNNHSGIDYFSDHQEATPPSSADSENDPNFNGGENTRWGYRSPKKFALNHGFDQRVDDYYDLITPDSDDYRSCSPRPWSSSDITSIHPHPPNTPAFSLREEFEQENLSLSVEDFMTMSDADFAEELYEQESTNSSSTYIIEKALHSAENLEIQQMRPLLGSPTERYRTPSKIPLPKSAKDSLPPLPKLPPQARSPSSANISATSIVPDDPLTEAAFVCKNIAKRLGYDLLYAIELAAKRPMKYPTDEVFEPGNLEMKTLAAHGMGEALDFDARQHIKALRSRGCITWEDNVLGGSAFDHGRLVSIHHFGGGLSKHRTDGIVVGAFRRSGSGVLQEVGENVDLRSFEEAVKVLKPILLKSRNRSPQMTPFPSRETSRYLANEAQEVGNTSFESWKSKKPYPKPPVAPHINRFGYNKAR